MEYITQFIELFLHLDKSLSTVIQTYGSTTYIILFLVILCETGLVVLPFLPGDSLLFAAGAFAAKGDMNVATLFMTLCVAAILGDSINYEVGRIIGPRIAQREKSRYVNKEHIAKTHQFYEKYGAKTIIIARFIPIIRTIAPFVAGLGAMSYKKFLQYNVIGGIAWVAICLFAGYLFGNIPLVKQNFTMVILAIISVSILPAVIEYIRHRSISKTA
ncbi:MAG: DedA family protein [Methylococcales bacterium]|nr:DedA family protein [Methylococcales bacterium]